MHIESNFLKYLNIFIFTFVYDMDDLILFVMCAKSRQKVVVIRASRQFRLQSIYVDIKLLHWVDIYKRSISPQLVPASWGYYYYNSDKL